MIALEIRRGLFWQANIIPFQDRPPFFWSVPNLPSEAEAWSQGFDLALYWAHYLADDAAGASGERSKTG